MSVFDPEDLPTPDEDYCIDCGVDQVGRCEPFGSYHAPACAFYIADAEVDTGTCTPCRMYFQQMSCNAFSTGDCGCPRCAGLCHCTPP